MPSHSDDRNESSLREAPAAHTPGPWRAVFSHPNGFDIRGPNDEDLGFVNASDGFDDPTMYPVEANARLFAAAPELLDALREGALALEEANKVAAAIAPRLVKIVLEPHVQRMRAAIAKAEKANG
jgi:hypothetical protein